MTIYTIPKHVICDALGNNKRNILYRTTEPRFFAKLVKDIPPDGEFTEYKSGEYLKVIKWVDEKPTDHLSPLLELKTELIRFLRNNPKRSLMPMEQAIALDKFNARVDALVAKGYQKKEIAAGCYIVPTYLSKLLRGDQKLSKKFLAVFKVFEDKTKL